MNQEIQVDFFRGTKTNETIEVSKLIESLSTDLNNFLSWPTEQILDLLDEFSKTIANKNNPIHLKYPGSGIAYIASWCRKTSLINLLENSLASVHATDRYTERGADNKRRYLGVPKGLIVHWMAGNVPTLGFLSLIQGIITKNKNIVKASSSSNELLSDLLEVLSTIGINNFNGKDLTKSIAAIRYDHSIRNIGEYLSRKADVRIFWGSDENVKSLKQLPCKLSVTDIVFSNKTSFMMIDNQTLKQSDLKKVAQQAAVDISIFEQKACASPHTIILETSAPEDIDNFASMLDEAIDNILSTTPKTIPTSSESSAILNLRTQYDMFHKAWYSNGLEYTILSDNEFKLGPSIGNRTIFIRKTNNLENVGDIITENVQTVGILAEQSAFEKLTLILAQKGVQRFTKIGMMTHFEIPWDGYFIPHHLVRWVSRYKE